CGATTVGVSPSHHPCCRSPATESACRALEILVRERATLSRPQGNMSACDPCDAVTYEVCPLPLEELYKFVVFSLVSGGRGIVGAVDTVPYRDVISRTCRSVGSG